MIRPAIQSGSLICITFGFSLTYITSALAYWRIVMYVNTLFCGVALVLQAFILVESHVWLMERGRSEDAERLLTKVRGDSGAAKAELGSILNNIEERKRLKDSMPKQSKLK